ncbi:DNA/RNA polymerase [Rhizodiscina lignyota]|uniref:DNA-directed RNA polymerase n=1 Tax=Rhizodiscina lignyota TaxID=1504668 RepID=A0A9P4MF34_9PEZI|nr:DNA/RNA polymerase [Rhizodiscina lignyota]
MLARAARRHRPPSKSLQFSFPELLSRRICPIQTRCITTAASRSRSILGDHLRLRHSGAAGARQDTRPLATAAEVLTPSPDPIPFLYRPNAQSPSYSPYPSKSNLRQWDASQVLMLQDSAMNPPQAVWNFLGVGADVPELFQNLHACLRVGRYERAGNLVKRIQETFHPSAPEVIEAHNMCLRAMVEDLEDHEDTRPRDILAVQKWFERDLKPSVPPNADTFALMCRAALTVQSGLRRDRTLRRYLSMAKAAGLFEDTLASEELEDSEAHTLERVYQGLSADRLLIGDDPAPAAGAPSTLTSHRLATGKDVQVKSVDQKGEGLRTVVKSLYYLDNPEAVPFPHDEALTNKEKEKKWTRLRQEAIEESVVKEALMQWRVENEHMLDMGISPALKSKTMTALLWQWHKALEPAVKEELKAVKEALAKPRQGGGEENSHRLRYGPYLEALPAEHISAITVIEAMKFLATQGAASGAKLVSVTSKIGKALDSESRLRARQKNNSKTRSGRRQSVARNMTGLTRQTSVDAGMSVRPSLESDLAHRLVDVEKEEWPTEVKTQVAALLMSKLLDVAKFTVDKSDGDTTEPQIEHAFRHETVYKNGRRNGMVHIHPEIVEKLKREPLRGILGARLPMVAEPKAWTGFKDGGYFHYPSNLVRQKESSDTQKLYTIAAIEKGDMDQVFQGLNVLGTVPWRINQNVFNVMLEAWNSGEEIAKIAPDNPEIPYPPEPEDPTDRDARKAWLQRVSVINNERSGLHSQRCFQNFQMEIARAYLHEVFYCPHNLDFRGRVYPIPPYLNHMGADNARGLLIFANGKELGHTGLKWLKIHLANVFGFDKASLEDRENFAIKHMDDITDSVSNPLSGNRWWLKAEDPWQCLATCFELKNALNSENPEKFVSHLPIHQDGTCNGLQHYAALGGDSLGARQVNLEPGDKPADIYTAVAELVKEHIAKDAEAKNPMARKLVGKLTRKVVKQTVMTNVYGVTFVGARAQVHKQLDEIIPDDGDPALDNYKLSAYIAHKIFASLDTLFTGAQNIQRWLGHCAARISTAITQEQLELMVKKETGETDDYGPKMSTKIKKFVRKGKGINGAGKLLSDHFRSCVVWTTPLKMPVVQPYRTTRVRQIRTTMQDIALREPQLNDPVAKRKQLQGFPPNFIHSLDATHMMLSAIKCSELGLTFSSVHDSFWTHAADIPVMNRVLRDAFVRMHSEDIIGRLAAEFKARYKKSIYLTHVYARSPVGKAIKKLRASKPAEQNMRAINSKASMKELLEEHKRQKLLRSKDPEERKKGEAMVTAASIFQAAGDAEAFEPPMSLGNSEEQGDAAAAADEAGQSDEALDMEASASDIDEAVDSESKEPSEGGAKTSKPTKQFKTEPKIPLWVPLTFPDVPAKGDFDVTRLRDSQYFFS